MSNIISKSVGLIGFLLVFSACSNSPAFIVNNTGIDIIELFVAPAAADQWGDELTGGEIILPDQRLSVPLDPDHDLYDIRAKDADGEYYLVNSRNLREPGTYALTRDDLYR